jgi:ribonuclease HII
VPPRIVPTLDHERAFFDAGLTIVAGVDEAGRGALAGPLVAAAVVLGDAGAEALAAVVRDSKTLTAPRRATACDLLLGVVSASGVGVATAAEIDRLGIVPANRIAMERAVDALGLDVDALLTDFVVLDRGEPQVALVDGDALSLSIAAASILAKVTRDRLMTDLAAEHPAYGFDAHAGYGTAAHLAALDRHGPCAHHRRSFTPVARALAQRVGS